MENYSKEREKDKLGDWKSPALYTHACGYKFCIGVDANGRNEGRGRAIRVELWVMPGEYDYQLKWPAWARFTIVLLHIKKKRRKFEVIISSRVWEKPNKPCICTGEFTPFKGGRNWHFHELHDFLDNDTLYFYLANINLY